VEELIFRMRDLALVRAPWRVCVSAIFAWEWDLENMARQDILHCRKTFGVALGVFISSWCFCFLDFVISTIEWRNAFLTGRILGGEATRDIYILFNYRDSCYFFLDTGDGFMQNFFYHSYICWTWDLEFHWGGGRGFGFASFHFARPKKKIRTC
jgi:hypothetical protein